jgi:cell division protein FtsA
VLDRSQKEAGTLVLDIGSGTTNMAIIEDGEIQYVGVLPIGSNLLTNDLAIGLKTDLEIAELVKIKQATLETNKNRYSKITHNNKIHSFDGEDITMITEARLDELFEYVERELKKIQKSQKLPGGVVIVGGMSNLPGIADFAKDKLQLPARTGSLHHISGMVDALKGSEYVTAAGLAIVDMLTIPQNSYSTMPAKKTIHSFFTKFRNKIQY